jgi:hypothetical protein
LTPDKLVQRWILARLRHRRFFSLGELNQVIRELLGPLNQRPFGFWRPSGICAWPPSSSGSTALTL